LDQGQMLIGTCGFSYSDWKGVLYPQAIKQGAMLSFYASQFNAVELDFTYYAIPNYRNMEAMAQRTPKNFTFSVKAHRSMTHEFSGDPEQDRKNFHSFGLALEPLLANGKLGCVLVQFPWGFKYTAVNQSYLGFVREELGDLPVVVEFRNVEWVRDDVFIKLGRLNLGFCCVDEPQLEGLFPSLIHPTSSIGYLRFHGRNAAKWWNAKEGWERYDYQYSKQELEEWAPKILTLQSQTQKTFVLFNNHHAGQAVINARMLKELLGE
jgi:uncharacterized protein YecE (DUF72 family)